MILNLAKKFSKICFQKFELFRNHFVDVYTSKTISFKNRFKKERFYGVANYTQARKLAFEIARTQSYLISTELIPQMYCGKALQPLTLKLVMEEKIWTIQWLPNALLNEYELPKEDYGLSSVELENTMFYILDFCINTIMPTAEEFQKSLNKDQNSQLHAIKFALKHISNDEIRARQNREDAEKKEIRLAHAEMMSEEWTREPTKEELEAEELEAQIRANF
jgi:hypothetical protein